MSSVPEATQPAHLAGSAYIRFVMGVVNAESVLA